MLSTIALAAPFHPAWGWGFVFIPIVFWLVIIGLIVTLIVTRRRRGWHPYAGGPHYGGPWGGPWASAQAARSAEAVLAERFAKGDIDEVEYRARLEVLRAQSPLPPQ